MKSTLIAPVLIPALIALATGCGSFKSSKNSNGVGKKTVVTIIGPVDGGPDPVELGPVDPGTGPVDPGTGPVDPGTVEPNTKVYGYSYYEVLVDPIAQALVKAKAKNQSQTPTIYFSLQGEMGATIFDYPAAYSTMAKKVTETLVDGKYPASSVKIGIGLNGDKIAGHPDAFSKIKVANGTFNVKEIRQLFEDVNFLGASFYPKVAETDSGPDFYGYKKLMDTFSDELSIFGINLAEFSRSGREFQWAEFGHGFHTLDKPWTTEANLDLAPLNKPGVIELAKKFYKFGIDFMKQSQKATEGVRVEKAYLWNLESIDVQGIYPESTSPTGDKTFASKPIQDLLKPRAAKKTGGIYSTVMLMGEWDHQLNTIPATGSSTTTMDSRCMQQVERAHKLNNKVLNFVINEHFLVERDPADEVRAASYENDFREKPKHFCRSRFKETDGVKVNTCEPQTKEDIAALTEGLTECFAKALGYGMDIAIIPHMDNFGINSWRNRLSFDPLKRY